MANSPAADTSPGHPASPWKLGGLSVGELGKRVWNEISEDEVLDRGAALAYYFLFALFPALLFMTALLGMLPIAGLMDRLMEYAAQALPPDATSMIQKTLGEIQEGARGSLLSLGALLALWSASGGMASIMSALNVAYDVEEPRPWWKRRGLAVLLTVAFALFIIGALVLMIFGPKFGATLADRLGLGPVFTTTWNIVSVPVVIVLVLVGIGLVYYLAPAKNQRWQWVTPGSAVALVLFLAISFGLRLYVTNFANYSATYGSIGGVILLILWLYLTGVALLVGAEVNAEIERAAARRGAPTAQAAQAAATGRPRPRLTELAPEEVDAVAPPLAADVTLAGRAIERWIDEARQRGWTPVALLGVAALLGWGLRRRRLGEVAETGRRTADTARQVARAVAAIERYRKAA